MFDLLRDYQLHVVAFSRKHLTDQEIAEHTGRLDGLAAFGGNLTTHLVARVASRRDDRVEYVDSAQVLTRYGLTQPHSQALFVIRPDGYIAWRADHLDYDACRQFLGRFHGKIASYEERSRRTPPHDSRRSRVPARDAAHTEDSSPETT